MIKYDELDRYQNLPIYFVWREGKRNVDCRADEWVQNKTILTYQLRFGDIRFYRNKEYAGVAPETDYGQRWFFVLAGDVTNKGRDKCVLCQCKTESRRDFNTFEVREMCPRCKI